MTNDQITLVMDIVKEQNDRYGDGRESIKKLTPFESMGLDSLDNVEMVLAVEEQFDIEISDEVTEAIRTPQGLIKAVKKGLENV